MKKTQVILAAAGSGQRLKSKIAKPLVRLQGKPLFVYSLEIFERCPLIDTVIVVAASDALADFAKIIRLKKFKKVKKIVSGGATRCASVSHGVNVLDDDTDLVLIHDAARPLVSEKIVRKALQACSQESAVVAAVAVKSTIKRVNPKDSYVEATLDRGFLWEIQTPQVFQKAIIVQAHQNVTDFNVTDDAALVERLGVKVKIVPGEYRNIKITTQDDLVVAAALLKG